MTSEHAKFERVFIIIRLLTSRSKGIPISEISKVINTSERTVFRYFKLLRNLGFTLEKIESPDNSLYRLRKNRANVSEVFDYLPELNYPAKVTLPSPEVKKYDQPVWIFKGRGSKEYTVYNSLVTLVKQHPEAGNLDTLYKKIKKKGIVIDSTFRIIPAPFYKCLRKAR